MIHAKVDGAPAPTFFADGGETGALIRAYNWSATPLGPAETWPSGLKTAVGMMLGAAQPLYVAWGPELISFYNDAYLPIVGAKHPEGLGRPFAHLWAEIWEQFRPIIETTMAGQAQHFVDMPIALTGRSGLPLGYFTFSYLPIRDDAGQVAGFCCVAAETTHTVLIGHQTRAERERLAQMFEQAPGFMATLEGPEHRFTLVNAACQTLIGGQDPVGKTFREALPELEGQGFYELLDKVFATGEPFQGISRKVRLARAADQSSEERVIDFIYQPLKDARGQVTGIFVEGSDVTERHEAGEQLRESEARFRAVFQNAGVGIARVSLDGTGWLEVNDTLCRMLGYSRADLLATKLSDIVHPEDRGLDCPSFLCKASGCRDRFVVEGRFLHRNGEPVWARQTISLVRNGAGQPDFQIAIIENTSAQKETEAELQRTAAEAQRAALIDSLTGLPNREAFRQTLERAVIGSEPITLILIDADHLKRANDTDGHAAGDALLLGLSNRLKSVCHSGAVAARLGGDEFALLLKEHVEGDRLDAMLGELCRPLQMKGLTLPHTASAGIAYPSASGSSATQLMQRADLALYEAKARGRATWQIFDHDLSAREQTKIGAIALLRRALDQRWVAPHYQPKVDLATGRIIGFEALLRIQRPGGDFHSATMVSHALSEPDLADEADRTILQKVLLDLQRWQARGIALPVALNLANSTIRRKGFARRVLELMNVRGVAASLLEVEITETVLLDGRSETAKENLRVFSEAGVRIALDDFGTGYASLSHLRTYAVDQLKIDQTFVQASPAGRSDRAIIGAILGLGASLSMQVIAEGIETEEQRRDLINAGCQLGQGFLFSPAVAADAVPRLLKAADGLLVPSVHRHTN